MKVAFNRSEETRGMFRKTKEYVLTYRVELTPEERAVVNDPETGDMILYDYYNQHAQSRWRNITVKFACRPEGGHFIDSKAWPI